MENINNVNPQIMLTSDTKYIKVEDMKKISLNQLSFDMPNNLLGRNGCWYKNKDGEEYYLKRRLFINVIMNELIGEYLSKYMSLDTVEYQLAYEEDTIVGLFSKNFRVPDLEYVYYEYLTKEEKEYLDRLIRSRAFRQSINEYKREYTDYFMRNFYANQGDRVFNVLCCRENGKVHLSTLFDYELSLIHPDDEYIVDQFLMQGEISCRFIKMIRKRDTCFRDSLDKVLGFNMENTLDSIESDFGIKIPDNVLEYYLSYDKERKKLMKEKILSKK